VARKYKYRVILDDSFGIGVLGATGRGTLEHHGMSPSDVTAVVGSMGAALGSVGGFCAGAFEVVDHQRLAGAGYCFSAALPPFLATAAAAAVDVLDSAEGRGLLGGLRANARELRGLLGACPGLDVVGGPGSADSPLVMLTVARGGASRAEQVGLLEAVAARARDAGVLVSVAQMSYLSASTAAPALKLQPMALHGAEDVKKAAAAVVAAARAVFR